jgi:MazG family protein
VALTARLRAPDGCPWDREQTHESLKPMLIEEAYEVLEAIDEGDDAALAGELGDLLLQVVFHSQVASETSRFGMADVIEGITSKIVRRHPHVFGEEKAATPQEVLRNWEAIKEGERAQKHPPGGDTSMLDSVSTRLPAVMEAFQLSTKVSRVGFDWPDLGGVLSKLDEETRELREAAVQQPGNHRAVNEEVGDLLFVMVNVARTLGVDPESALKAANRKFRRRFRHVELRLLERGKKPADATVEEMDVLWNEAKAEGLVDN